MYKMFQKVVIPGVPVYLGTGWLPPLPDMRDYTEDSASLKPLVSALGVKKKKALPKKVDLRPWCSPIRNQGSLGSCTAHAAIGIVEYYQRRAFKQYINGSRLFVYKATRNLLQVTGDTGAWLRNAMAALVLCGVPDEKYWPYTDADPEFDIEPPSFVYAVADNFESLKYFAHDPVSEPANPGKTIESVKKYLATGVPSMFGFWGFASFEKSDAPGHIPFPCPTERAQWGHAIVAVGYDDDKKIVNTKCNVTTKGALLIRNSWGTGWGDAGYGWIPYEYVAKGLAMDFWSLMSMEYVETGNFDLDS